MLFGGWHPKAAANTSAHCAVVIRPDRGWFGARIVWEDAIAEEPCDAKEFPGAPVGRLIHHLSEQVGSEVGGVLRHVRRPGSAGRVVQAACVAGRADNEVSGEIMASHVESLWIFRRDRDR